MEWTVVAWSCCLIVFTISNGVHCVQTVLGFQQWQTAIPDEVLDCMDRHGNVYPMFVIVPLKLDAAVEIVSPILNNSVRFSA